MNAHLGYFYYLFSVLTDNSSLSPCGGPSRSCYIPYPFNSVPFHLALHCPDNLISACNEMRLTLHIDLNKECHLSFCRTHRHLVHLYTSLRGPVRCVPVGRGWAVVQCPVWFSKKQNKYDSLLAVYSSSAPLPPRKGQTSRTCRFTSIINRSSSKI